MNNITKPTEHDKIQIISGLLALVGRKLLTSEERVIYWSH